MQEVSLTDEDAKKCADAAQARREELAKIVEQDSTTVGDFMCILLGSLMAEMEALRLYLDDDSHRRTILKMVEGSRLNNLPTGILGWSLRHDPPPDDPPSNPNPHSPWSL